MTTDAEYPGVVRGEVRTTAADVPPLTPVEAEALASYEEVIDKGLHSFVDIGQALRAIRDSGDGRPKDRLYRRYGTFEEYCRGRWGMKKSTAYYLIDAAAVVTNLKTSTVVEVLPANERQARELARLRDEAGDIDHAKVAEVWGRLVAQTPDAKGITARRIRAEVDVALGAIRPLRLARPEGGCTVDDLYALAASGERFGTIYADPPWQYDNRASRGAAANHYQTMSLADIAALPVKELAAENAHLHLWTTVAFHRDAYRILEAWGFEFASEFVWTKPTMGTGNYWRLAHEYLLLGVRGSAPFADKAPPAEGVHHGGPVRRLRPGGRQGGGGRVLRRADDLGQQPRRPGAQAGRQPGRAGVAAGGQRGRGLVVVEAEGPVAVPAAGADPGGPGGGMTDVTSNPRRAALEAEVRHQERLWRDARSCGLRSLARRRLRRLRSLRAELAALGPAGEASPCPAGGRLPDG
jgi:hypothetical protein